MSGSPGNALSFGMHHDHMAAAPVPGETCRDPKGCGGCTLCEAGEPELPYSGPAVVGGALWLFVMPLLLAAGGALLFRGHPAAQLGGGAAGLALGMGLARLGHRWLNRVKEGDR
ncbi:MAG TPA: hypothetical protein PLR87_06875 [Thermoanaerobaculaceae bacterium]|nr:hypothetical protein [Thermoanaerobaculaceae bacterium]